MSCNWKFALNWHLSWFVMTLFNAHHYNNNHFHSCGIFFQLHLNWVNFFRLTNFTVNILTFPFRKYKHSTMYRWHELVYRLTSWNWFPMEFESICGYIYNQSIDDEIKCGDLLKFACRIFILHSRTKYENTIADFVCLVVLFFWGGAMCAISVELAKCLFLLLSLLEMSVSLRCCLCFI